MPDPISDRSSLAASFWRASSGELAYANALPSGHVADIGRHLHSKENESSGR